MVVGVQNSARSVLWNGFYLTLDIDQRFFSIYVAGIVRIASLKQELGRKPFCG